MTRTPVRLLYRLASARQNSDLGTAEIDRRLAYLRRLVSPDTTIDIAAPKTGPVSIESRTDEALAVPELLKGVREAEASGYDAVVISCFGDPGLDAAREQVTIPVVASGQSAMHVAAQLGGRFSVLWPRDFGGSWARENPVKYGFAHAYASTRGVGLSVLDLNRDRAGTFERLVRVGRACVEEDGADTLVLGCLSMAFHDVAAELSARLGVPVVNPVHASLSLAEMLVRAGIAHSKLAYPAPGAEAAPVRAAE
jgi:allantoin racemase